MDDLVRVAAVTGAASGLLALAARREPAVGWIALSPLGVALSTCGLWAALAGALTGATLHGAATLTQPARIRPLGFVFGAAGWGLGAGLGGLVLEVLRTSGVLPAPVALACVLPLVALGSPMPMRLAGAPRWIHAALACTQEPWPVVLRAGWFGGDATVTALLAVWAAAACLLAPGPTHALVLAGALVALVVAVLALAARSLARTRRALGRLPRVRVATVVVDGAPPDGAPVDGLWPLSSPEYRDVAATVARYTPHVARAASEGASLVVLPEVAVLAGGGGAEGWLDAVARWAEEHRITVVAPHFDPASPANTLTVVEPSGRRWTYDKQHPAPGLEPPPRRLEAPGPHLLERGWPLSTVICVDLDYPDLVAPVRAARGLLAVPANDWPAFAEDHHRSAVWAAVLTGTTVIRAAGHGISSVHDGAGAVLGRASSLDGPVVLVVDVPLSAPPAGV